MDIEVEIAERFAQALDAEDYALARELLSEECHYLCRGQLHIGPAEIIASYQGNGDSAKRKFDNVAYESTVSRIADGVVLIQFTDNLTLNEDHFTFLCEQVIEVGAGNLIARIEHRDIPGQREALAVFLEDDAAKR